MCQASSFTVTGRIAFPECHWASTGEAASLSSDFRALYSPLINISSQSSGKRKSWAGGLRFICGWETTRHLQVQYNPMPEKVRIRAEGGLAEWEAALTMRVGSTPVDMCPSHFFLSLGHSEWQWMTFTSNKPFVILIMLMNQDTPGFCLFRTHCQASC